MSAIGSACTFLLSLSMPARAPPPSMQLKFGGDMIKKMMGSAANAAAGISVSSASLNDAAPSWSELTDKLDRASTDAERAFRSELESGRAERACSLAKKRLFDLPEGESPRVVLYRDTASWCPYCEKVWLVLEEKRVPYEVIKVNMNCYGEKPSWFWEMQPSGGIPVAKLDGNIIRESNDIIMAIERSFPETKELLPADDERVNPLLRLEREIFSAWFRWLTSGMNEGAQRANFETLLRRVDGALKESGGPYFLGDELSLVDCMFAPFLERMAASLPYYKALTLRQNEQWPHIESNISFAAKGLERLSCWALCRVGGGSEEDHSARSALSPVCVRSRQNGSLLWSRDPPIGTYNPISTRTYMIYLLR